MAYIDWWNRTGPVTLGERFGLNEISIARNTLSPTKSYTAKAPGNIPLMAPELPEDLTPMPNIPDLLREEGVQVGEQVKDGGRIGLEKGTHWSDFLNPGELLIRQPSEEEKIEFKEDLSKGVEFAKEKWKALWPELVKDFTPIQGEARALGYALEEQKEVAKAMKEKKYIEAGAHAVQAQIMQAGALPWWTGVGAAAKIASKVLRLGKLFTGKNFKPALKGDQWSHEARKVFNTKVKDDLGYGITVTKASQNGEHVYQLGLTGEKSIYSKDLKSLMEKRNAWVISKVKPLREKEFISSSEFGKVLQDKGISAHTTTERGILKQLSTLADIYGIEKIKAGAGTGRGFWYKSPSPEKLEEIYKLRLKPYERVPIAKKLIKDFNITSHKQLNKVLKEQGYSEFRFSELNKHFPEIKGISFADPKFVPLQKKFLPSGDPTPKTVLNSVKYNLRKTMSGIKTERFIVGTKKSTGFGKDVELMHTTPKKKKTGELLHWDDLKFGSAKENQTYANGLESIRRTFNEILSNVAKKHSGKNMEAIIETSALLRRDYGFPNKMTVKEYVSRINDGLVDLASKTGGSVRGDILNITGNKLKFVPNKIGIDYSKVPGWGMITGDLKKFEKTFKKIRIDAKGTIILDVNGMPAVKKGYKLSDKEASDILMVWENAPEQIRRSLTTEAFTGKLEFAEGGRTGFKAAGAVFPYDIIKGITEDPKKTTALTAPIVAGAAIAKPTKAVEIAKEISKKTGNLGKQVLNKALGIAFSPTGLAGLLAWHSKGKDAKEIATDPWTYSYAPFLGVGAQAVEFITKNIKSPAIKSVIQRGLSLGVFTPAQIIKASRITTPAGWLAVIGTAIAKMPEDKKSVFLKEMKLGPEFGEKLKEEKEEYYTEGEHYAMDGIESLMK